MGLAMKWEDELRRNKAVFILIENHSAGFGRPAGVGFDVFKIMIRKVESKRKAIVEHK